MSMPAFSPQGELFSTAGLSASLFAATDRYRLFAKLVYPQLVPWDRRNRSNTRTAQLVAGWRGRK